MSGSSNQPLPPLTKCCKCGFYTRKFECPMCGHLNCFKCK